MSETVPPSSNLPPAQQPVTPNTTASQPQPAPNETASRGTVLQLPSHAPTLPSGERLAGIIAERLSPSQFVVSTRLGAVTVRSETPLPLGARVFLQTVTSGPQPAIQITLPAQPASRIAQPAPAPVPAASAGQANIVAAGFVPPAGPGAAPPATGPVFADNQSQIRGSIVNATITRTNLGVGGSGPVRLEVGPGRTAPTTVGPGTRLSIRIAAISRPGTSAAPAPPGTGAITGTVVGKDISGNALVRTNHAELALSTPRPLPVGSNLLLQTIGRPLPFSPTAATPHALATASSWGTLQDLLQFSAATPAQTVVAQSVPQPGPQFTGALLFFIAALRAGDLRGWLGADATRGIEREAVFGRMMEEFGLMQRLASEPAGQEWRLFLLPVLSDALLHQMRLFVRDNQDDGTDDEMSKETRFVIEVTFSRLGPFQFDGLARARALELIIRTEQEIGKSMQREIGRIFQDTTSALGLDGKVAFRTEAFFELQPLQDSGLAHDAGIVA